MNWTGGELTRAAHTKAKALKQKQKAHFARARAAAAARQSVSASLQARSGIESQPIGSAIHTQVQSYASQQSQVQHALPHALGIDRLEYRLLLKRQELLRRPDWLDPQVVRPLEIDFPKRSDKALIGRRHAIRKISASKTQAVRARRQDPTAIPKRGFDTRKTSSQQDVSLRIKIGTHALDSQTQQSSLLQARPVRQASPDLELLSEEPMLLDSDDDLFERPMEYNRAGIVDDSSVDKSVDGHAASQQSQSPSVDHAHAFPSKLVQDKNKHKSSQLRAPGTISDTALPWSTSVFDGSQCEPSTHVTATQAVMAETEDFSERLKEDFQRGWKHLCSVSTSSNGDASLLVHHTQWQPSSSSSLGHSLPLHNLPQPVVLKQAVMQDSVEQAASRDDAALLERLLPLTKKPDTNAEQTQEESWRKFILGDGCSDSGDSLPSVAPRMAHAYHLPSSTELEPLSPLVADDVDHSVVATRGASTYAFASSKIMAGPNSSLDGIVSSTPSTIRTTAAVASSLKR